jgi:hypothetical protein
VVALWIALAAFVVLWVFDVFSVRDWVPAWLPFLIALGLELRLFLSRSASRPRARGRLPLDVDRERYGYGDADELVLVRDGERDVWLPYSGETPEEVEALVDEADAREEDDEPFAEEPPPPQRLRRLLVGLAIIAALAGVVWLSGSRGWEGLDGETRAEAAARFSEEAAQIVGRRVTIRCDESREFVGAIQHADGVAEVGGSLAFLTPELCYDLYRLAFEDEVSFSRTARAIAVLAHEAWHLRGERNEGVTECYALQSGVQLGTQLGLSESTARRMMRQQLAENALRARGSLEYLVPDECRDGGRLDLDPQSSEFP